jgi:hypothetical protein
MRQQRPHIQIALEASAALVQNLTRGMRLMRWLGVGDDPHEPRELERLIAEKLRAGGIIQSPSVTTLEGKGAEAPLDADTSFLKYRFGDQLRNYRRWGGPYAFAFMAFSLGVIVTGLASSGIAAGWNKAHWARWSILILGIVTGVLTAINQLWRPGQKGVSRTKGANLLCREGWSFLRDRGRYEDIHDPRQAWTLFMNEVEKITAMVAAIDEAEPKPLAASESVK